MCNKCFFFNFILNIVGIYIYSVNEDLSKFSFQDLQNPMRKSAMKSMTAKLQQTIRSVTGRGKILRASLLLGDVTHETDENSESQDNKD